MIARPSSAQATPAPVLALHSLLLDGTMFEDLRADTGRRIVAPDHRGQGSRSAEVAGSIEELAVDAERTLDEIGSPVHLVGSSMGAYVAMVVAARHPDKILSCVLSAATADAEQRPEKFADLVHRIRSEGPAQLADELARLMFGEVFVAGDSARFRHWRDRFASRPASVADAVERVAERRDLWCDVENLRVPVLLCAGALDTAKTPADMQRISDRIGCPDPVVFSASGHTPFVEQPREMAGTLAPFWLTHDPGRNTDV